MTSINVDLQKTFLPYLTDIGVAIVFGLGYYVIKYLYGDSRKTSQTKTKNVEAFWSKSKTIEEFNTQIKNSEEDGKLNPFEILEHIRRKCLNPDICTYNNLLNACFVNSNFTAAEKLIEEITEFGSPVQPDLSTYNIFLKGISCRLDGLNWNNETDIQIKNELMSKADSYFSDLIKLNFQPNDITINTMLDVLIKGGEIKRAWDLFDIMKSKYNIEPDKYSYSTIIKALKYELDPTKIERAFGIWNYLRTQSVSGNDEIIFNCLIEVCWKWKLVDKAEKVYNEMKSLGISPSKITYAIMIKGYGQVYNIEKAFEIFNEMKLNWVQPNEIIYGCLLNTCSRCSQLEKVSMIYDEMKTNNVKMNVILYTTIIKAYSKAKDIVNATKVYETMLNDENIQPNIVIHNAMLDACVECRDIKKMNEIYESIKHKAWDSEENPMPDLITYSTVIKGYARNKEMDKVFALYKFLQNQKNEFTMDEVIYNSILDACVKTSNFSKAIEVYSEMKANHIKLSNVTYSIWVKLYANNDENEKAFEIWTEMRENNIKPGIIVYTCLIQSSLRSKKFDRAIMLFETLKQENLKPDYVLYNTVVNGCIYHSKWENACKYTLESFKNNVRMGDNIYKNILEKLTMNYCNMDIDKKCDYAAKILKELKDKNVRIDDSTYKKVSQMIYKNKSTEQVYSKYGNKKYDYRKY